VSTRDNIATDIVLSPFGADAAAMVDAARCLDESGFDGVWTLDHFSGSMLDRPWSREPFTVLGAMAAVTSELRVGPLVANMVNRHPALLASAASTLQSIAGGRSVLGLGSGAARGSRFAAEQDAIGRVPGPVEERRRQSDSCGVVVGFTTGHTSRSMSCTVLWVPKRSLRSLWEPAVLRPLVWPASTPTG
jgi:alkanesulfonate monooxygenase SsuD/methylene tetrahydromethanopterin reductase-like flavin-dependent oxidoreductase (luciferase family)